MRLPPSFGSPGVMPRPIFRRLLSAAAAPSALAGAAFCLGACAATPAVAQGPVVAQEPAVAQEVVHSNRETFTIPFAASAADLAAAGATEARLLVSADRGRQWREAGRAAPGGGGFRFVPPADGDYWFSVLTVDAQGMPAPADVLIVPQLHVRTDRVPPTVALDASPAGDGTVDVRWNAVDAAADPASLVVTFTPDGGVAQRVPVAAGLSGSFRIPAQRATGTVTVTVADAAGNVGSATRRTDGFSTEPNVPPRLPAPSGVVAAGALQSAAPYAPSPAVRSPAPSPSPRPTQQSRSFKIGYAVDAVGSSGVGKVDLYITPDGGRHWYSYGQDADRTSPAEVSVPSDGEYGFCVRVRSGAGLVQSPPRSGDAPDVRVTVDGTPPSVKILSAAQGRGAEANTLTLSWRTRDDRPAAAPVRVELADSPAGPWEVVRDWSADVGAVSLPLRPGRHGRTGAVYVRVTARDEAGNEQSAVTPNGVPVDLTRPSARVLGVVR